MGLEANDIEAEPEELRPNSLFQYKKELARLSIDKHYRKVGEFDNNKTTKESLKEASHNGRKFVFLYNSSLTKISVFEYISLDGN